MSRLFLSFFPALQAQVTGLPAVSVPGCRGHPVTPNPTMKSSQTQALLQKGVAPVGVAPEGSGFEGAALWPHPPQPSDGELE